MCLFTFRRNAPLNLYLKFVKHIVVHTCNLLQLHFTVAVLSYAEHTEMKMNNKRKKVRRTLCVMSASTIWLMHTIKGNDDGMLIDERDADNTSGKGFVLRMHLQCKNRIFAHKRN